MDNTISDLRFVASKWMPFLSGIVFVWIFYGGYFLLEKPPLVLSSYSVSEFATKYGVFIPVAYAILVIIFLYILYLFAWIVRLRFWGVNLILLLGVYGFSLFFWIQLVYYEPRFTDVAIFIIDSFGKPMMYASIGTLWMIFVSIFIKRKL